MKAKERRLTKKLIGVYRQCLNIVSTKSHMKNFKDRLNESISNLKLKLK